MKWVGVRYWAGRVALGYIAEVPTGWAGFVLHEASNSVHADTEAEARSAVEAAVDEALGIAPLKARIAELEEALRDVYEGVTRQLAEPRNHDDDQVTLTGIATRCELVALEPKP